MRRFGTADCICHAHTGEEERRGRGQRLGVINGMLPLQRCEDETRNQPFPCKAGGSIAVTQNNRAGASLNAMIFYTTSLELQFVSLREHARRTSVLDRAFKSCQEAQRRFEEVNPDSLISLSELAGCIHRVYIGRRDNRYLRLKGLAVFSNYDGEGFGTDFRYGRTWFDCSREIPIPDENLHHGSLRVCVVALMSEHKM